MKRQRLIQVLWLAGSLIGLANVLIHYTGPLPLAASCCWIIGSLANWRN